MSRYILPALITLLLLYSFIKKNNTYQSFVVGAKSSFDLVLTSFPYIATIFIAIEVFNISGLSILFADFVAPFFEFVGIPKELSQLVILKNFSGCGSLAVLENIFQTYGVDSLIGNIASTILGSSETTLYVIAIYTSAVAIKNTRGILKISLFCDLVAICTAVWIWNFI